MDADKKNVIIISTIIVLLIAIIILIICFNTILMDERPKKTNNNDNISDEVEDQDEIEDNKKDCVGRYYGEYITYLDNGEVSLDLKYTYILNGDNTYSANFGSSGNTGTYTIDGDMITFKHATETNRSSEVEDKYEIADDCSYIMIEDSDSDIYSFKLNRQ